MTLDIKTILGEQWAELLPRAEDLLRPIAEQLKEERQAGIKIYPYKENIFRVFKELNPSEIKVILIGQDPYHFPPGQATGRAFECGKYISPSWRKIAEGYKEYLTTATSINPDHERIISGELQTWSEQGVFLLNKSLTVRERIPNSHTRLWEPFTKYVISALLTSLEPRAVVVLGAEAAKLVGKVPAPHKLFMREHPAAASYQGRAWKYDKLFEEVNQFLKFIEKQIIW